jgi:hypothetical protein
MRWFGVLFHGYGQAFSLNPSGVVVFSDLEKPLRARLGNGGFKWMEED